MSTSLLPTEVLHGSLPPSYQNVLAAEGPQLLARIKKKLKKIVSAGSKQSDFTSVLKLTKLIHSYFSLQHKLSIEDKLLLISQLWTVQLLPLCSLPVRSKVLSVMTQILGKKEWALRGKLAPISAQTLRSLMIKAYENKADQLPLGSRSSLNQYQTALQHFAATCRWYLPESDGMQLFRDTRIDLQRAHSTAMFTAQVHLQLLFPPFVPEAVTLVPEIMAIWATIDRCSGWDLDWMILITRIIKASGSQDVSRWDQYIPTLFARIQDSLYLSVQGTAQAGGRSRPSTARNQATQSHNRHQKKAAKLAIRLLGYGNTGLRGDSPGDEELSHGMLQLKRLILSTRTYFHPSNQGVRQITLGAFMEQLCLSFVKRLGCDRAGNVMEAEFRQPSISLADRKAFVNLMLPLIEMGLYAKNRMMISMAQSSLRHISWVAPKTVHDRFIPAIYEALDPSNLSQAHQGSSAIKALTVIVQPLLQGRPLLAPHLPHLLNVTLPGLDPNDTMKTLGTLMLYKAVLSWVPVVDPSDVNDGAFPSKLSSFQHSSASLPPGKLVPDGEVEKHYRYGIDTDEDASQSVDEKEQSRDAMWRAGPKLCQWALGVLDRMFLLIENALKAAKQGSAQRMESVVMFVFHDVAQKLFAQMHPSIRKQARKKVIQFVTSKRFPNAQLQARSLVAAAAFADPELTLAALLNALETRIVKTNSSKEDLVWCTALLGAACRNAGLAILEHKKKISKIIKFTVNHDEFEVHKQGGKLLRRVMRGLAEQYVMDVSSFRTSSLTESDWTEIAVQWGTTTDWDKVQPEWHIPTKKEYEFAVELLKDNYLLATESIDAFMKSSSEESSNVKWRRSLRLLYQCVRGARSLISDNLPSDHEDVLNMGYPQVYSDGGASVSASGVSKSLGEKGVLETSTMSACSILQYVTSIADYLAKQRHADASSHRGVVKVIKNLVCSGASGDKHMAEMVWTQYAHSMTKSSAIKAEITAFARYKAQTNEGVSSIVGNRAHHIVPRSMMIETVVSLHHTRRYVAALSSGYAIKGLKMTKPYKKFLKTLEDLACHEWTEVRQVAKKAVDRFGVRFSYLLRDRVGKWVDRLGVAFAEQNLSKLPGIAHTGRELDHFSAVIEGTIQLMNSHKVVRWIAGDWDLFSRFIRSGILGFQRVVESLPAEKQSVTRDTMQALFASVVSKWSSLAIVSSQDAELRVNLLDALVTNGESCTNWKYQLMSMATFTTLLRSPFVPNFSECDLSTLQVLPSAKVWKLVSKWAQTNVAPVRLSAARLLDSMICCLEQWIATNTLDMNYTKQLLADAKSVLLEPSLIESLMNTLADDHKAANLTADGSEGGKVQYSVGIGELVNLTRRTVHWTTSRYARTSSNFDASHANLFRGMMSVCGPAILPAVEPVLETFMFSTDGKEYKTRAAAAAEVSAGILRGGGDCLGELNMFEVSSFDSGASSAASSESDFAVIEVDSAGDVIIPKLSTVAVHMSAATVSDWVDMVRYVADGGDPRRVSTLLNVLETEITQSLSRPAANQTSGESFTKVSNQLRLLNSIIIELGERASNPTEAGIQKAAVKSLNQLASTLVPVLLGAKSHPYRMIRTDIASTLGIFVNSFSTVVLNLPRAQVASRSIAKVQVTGSAARSSKKSVSVRLDRGAAINTTLAATAKVREQLAKKEAQRKEATELKLKSTWCNEVTKDLLASITSLLNEDTTEEASKDEIVTRSVWTVLSFAHTLLKVSDSFLYSSSMVQLLPAIVASQGHSDSEVAKLSKNVLEICSQGMRCYWTQDTGELFDPKPAFIVDVVQQMLTVGKSSIWRQRATCGLFLGALLPHHGATILGLDSQAQSVEIENQIRNVMETLLMDSRIEVQVPAKDCLTGIWSSKSLDSISLKTAMERYESWARTKLPKIFTRSGREAASEAGKNIKDERDKALPKFKKRQAACLALSATLLAFPYDISDCGPDGVVFLSKLVKDPVPSGKFATETLSEFKRTHQDGWQLHKLKFSRDQLMDLDGLLVSPSYYA